MDFFKNLGKSTSNAVNTAMEGTAQGGVGEVLERVLIARGGIPETITVLYKNSKKEDRNTSRYILRKSKGGGTSGTVAAATGNFLHSAAVLAADTAGATYVRPVVVAADVAASMVGLERSEALHDAEERLHDTAVGAVDTVIVKPVVMAVSAVERLFGVGGDVEIIDEDSYRSSNQSGRESIATTYKYAKLSIDESSSAASRQEEENGFNISSDDESMEEIVEFTYDNTYPLTAPVTNGKDVTYRIAVITDLDRGSRSGENTYMAKLKLGFLTYNTKNQKITVKWDEKSSILTSSRNENGRGMELSELNVFNGKLYACDDKTGILFEIIDHRVREFTQLINGDGSLQNGFKCEWGTVKNGILYIGSHGTHQVNEDGEITDINNEWVKKVLPNGEVYHVNWHFNYEALRKAVGISSPGYIVHEACCWSDVHEKWFFLPRKINPKAYSADIDQISCSNILISCDEEFREFEILEVGELQPSHGFSSFKFVPETDDEVVVAIKTKETGEETASYIMAFTIDGDILLEETEISAEKYEGLEFV